MVLTECGPDFGLLVARSTQAAGAGLLLEVCWFLHVAGPSFEFRELRAVVLREVGGCWALQETEKLRFLPRPSRLPYRVRYLGRREFERLDECRRSWNAAQIYREVQPIFGELPDFSYENNRLISPAGYAEEVEEFGGELIVL
jgi:hypothetical protein